MAITYSEGGTAPSSEEVDACIIRVIARSFLILMTCISVTVWSTMTVRPILAAFRNVIVTGLCSDRVLRANI